MFADEEEDSTNSSRSISSDDDIDINIKSKEPKRSFFSITSDVDDLAQDIDNPSDSFSSESEQLLNSMLFNKTERASASTKVTSSSSINTTTSGHKNSVGMKLLMKMGYQPGKGLGLQGEGRTEPIQVTVKKDKMGLGTGAGLSYSAKRSSTPVSTASTKTTTTVSNSSAQTTKPIVPPNPRYNIQRSSEQQVKNITHQGIIDMTGGYDFSKVHTARTLTFREAALRLVHAEIDSLQQKLKEHEQAKAELALANQRLLQAQQQRATLLKQRTIFDRLERWQKSPFFVSAQDNCIISTEEFRRELSEEQQLIILGNIIDSLDSIKETFDNDNDSEWRSSPGGKAWFALVEPAFIASLQPASLKKSFARQIWLPRVRHELITSTSELGNYVQLIEWIPFITAWTIDSDAIPADTMHDLFEIAIKARLRHYIEHKKHLNPSTSQNLLDLFMPLIKYSGGDLEFQVEWRRQLVKQFTWTPVQPPEQITPLLKRSRHLLNPDQFTMFMHQTVGRAIEDYLKTFLVIDPANQDLEPLQRCLPWHKYFDLSLSINSVVMPKLLECLNRWLNIHISVDEKGSLPNNSIYRDIADWYEQWKELLRPFFMEKAWKPLLDAMNRHLDLIEGKKSE